MQKKILAIAVLVLFWNNSGFASVKNLPFICKYPDNMSSYMIIDAKDQYIKYSLYQDEIYKAVLKVIDNPKLILEEDFFKAPEYNEKKKCPSGRKIKPFDTKYERDKFKINSSYIRELKRRIHPKDGWIYSTKNNETSHILFLIYVLSLQSKYDFDKFKINLPSCKADEIKPPLIKKEFNCLKRYFHTLQSKKKGLDFVIINDVTVEIIKNTKIDLKDFSLEIALKNLPNICKSSKPFLNLTNMPGYYFDGYIDPKGRRTEGLTDFKKLTTLLSENPSIFFTKKLGFDNLSCRNPYLLNSNNLRIQIKPVKQIDLEKGKLRLNKAYLNNVKDLPKEQKEHLKFLINLILLNNNTSLDSYVDVSKEKKKKFTISFSKVRNEYEKLSKNPSIKFIKDVNTARTVLKYLLILL